MNKKQLVDVIAKECYLKRRDVEAVVDTMIITIMNKVAEGEKVQLTGFGAFERRERKERTIKIPSTKEDMVVPASKSPAFSAGSIFKEKVNK